MAGRNGQRIRTGLALIAALGVTLGVWELIRKSQVVQTSLTSLLSPVPSKEAEPIVDPQRLEAEFRQPVELERLVQRTREEFKLLSEREHRLDHTVDTIVQDVNPKARNPPAEQHVESIAFRGGKKYRQTVSWVDLATGKPKKGVSKEPRFDPEKIEEVFPFHRVPEEEGYRYSFLGIEQVLGLWTVHLAFEPSGSPAKRFKGEAWIEPSTARPVRVFCRFAEKKPFLDQFSMLLEYGTVETGDWQLIRTAIDGSGGFAMIQKHYRSEIKFFNYHPSP